MARSGPRQATRACEHVVTRYQSDTPECATGNRIGAATLAAMRCAPRSSAPSNHARPVVPLAPETARQAHGTYLPVLAAQRTDTETLARDAEARGWISEADRHRRLIERLDAYIRQAHAR